MMRASILAAAVLCGTLALADAQEPPAQAGPPTGAISGRVVHVTTQRGIEAATVAVVGATGTALTDGEGRFLIRGIPTGIYGVRVAAIGYRPIVVANVSVSSGKPAIVTAQLDEQAVLLGELTVEAAYTTSAAEEGTSTQSLGEEDVRRAPGVQEDVVRAVALLPGVAVTTAGRNDLAVRGGAPYENLFVIDGLEVPNINHFGSQGSSGGPLSLVNIDFVQDVAFSSGGFAVPLGDRTSSATRITLREGSRDAVSGEVNLSATGFWGIAEGPLGGRGSFLASVRRSYLDLLFNAAGFSFVPTYWDLTFKGVLEPGPRDRLSLLFVGALDDVTFSNATADDRYDNSRILAPAQRQYFTGVTWQRSLDRGLLTMTLGRTFTRFRSEQLDSLGGVLFRNLSEEGENSLRAELRLDLSPRVELTAGNVAVYGSQLDYQVGLVGYLRTDAAGAPQPLLTDTAFTAFRNGTFAQAVWRAASSVRITGGLRLDYYEAYGDALRLSPRLAVAVGLGPRTTAQAAAGRYVQGPSSIWLVGDSTNPANLRPLIADHVVLSVERRIRPDLKVQVEGYVKRMRDYPARVFRPQAVLQPSGFEDAQTDIPFGLEPLTSTATGRAFGAEVFVQKRFSEVPLYGLVSVSASRVELTGIDGIRRPGAFDSRFIGTVSAGYRLNPRWEVSGKFRVATGLPTTPFDTAGPNAGRLDFTRYNAGPRLPVFHQLDARVDRRWAFRGWQLVAYLDVQNVYGRENVSGYRWDQRTQTVEADQSLGVLPSIGINIEF